MRYSQRYHYLVDAPGIHHWDFATEGMLASTVLGNRGANGPRLRQAFETTNRYLLAFFNAYVKGDQGELAFLRRDPAANGAPSGLATIRELAAIRPAPSAEELDQLIRAKGLDSAMKVFATAQRDDPTALLFEERTLNSLGYRLFRNGKQPEGIAIFRENVRLHPASSNVYDSLAEALETMGNRAEAIDASRKGLEVLEREGLPADRRAQVKQLFDDRLKRLAP
jgi:tetratricopeptide (TPR) repeat protein